MPMPEADPQGATRGHQARPLKPDKIGLETVSNLSETRLSGFELDSLMALASGGGKQRRINMRKELLIQKFSGS